MTQDEFLELRYLVHWDSRRRAQETHRVKTMAACAGKHSFTSFEQADRTIGHRLRQFSHAYHCTVCSAWHIGGRRVNRDRRLELQRKRRETV